MNKLIFVAILLLAGVMFGETVVSGPVFGIWYADSSPYHIQDSVYVPAGSTLVIEPGCTVIAQAYKGFKVDTNAVLKAVGTETDSIIFTSDAPYIPWYGIRFLHSSPTCSLSYCKVEWSDTMGVICINSNITISNCTITHNRRGGIYCKNSNPLIYSNLLEANDFGSSGYAPLYGGGICCDSASPTIIYNQIIGNFAARGGAIYCGNHSHPLIAHNTIEDDSTHGDGVGGGICCEDSSNPTITDNTFGGDTAIYAGGAIYCFHSNPVIENNTITNCGAGQYGGGIDCDHSEPIIRNNFIGHNSAHYGGGGISCRGNSNPVISHNVIIENRCLSGGGGWGGGIYSEDSSLTGVENCVIRKNRACSGGGIYCWNSPFLVIANCTIEENVADSSGGGICILGSAEIVIFNTILWEDSATLADEVYLYTAGGGATLFVAYSDMDSADYDFDTMGTGALIWGEGNFFSPPFFRDTLCHIPDTSVCVDAGTGTLYVSLWDTTLYAPTSDFENDDRPAHSGWDVGADEYTGPLAVEFSHSRPKKIEISAHPNPFNSSCIISVPAGAKVGIYDLQGCLVYAFPGISKGPEKYIWYPDRSIPAGVYLVRAMTEDERVAERKILLLK